ncbi:hypothetical protein ABH944_005244 [Caballeronia udeis]|uniref:Uncharacterized protein n=1 Tax=Caballeronia udeis TaxID=1232866 RepID=A0ABW8MMX4_9BURK
MRMSWIGFGSGRPIQGFQARLRLPKTLTDED